MSENKYPKTATQNSKHKKAASFIFETASTLWQTAD
jgi:hypothetical protein